MKPYIYFAPREFLKRFSGLEIVTYNVELNILLDFINKNTDYVTRSDYIFPQIVGVFRQYHHPDLS